jgi:membrane protease YdiL (CAAX protease family)
LTQLIGLLAISWLLIWSFEKGNLSVLGLNPTKCRLKYFATLFIVSAICSSTAFLLRICFAKEVYTLNPTLSFISVSAEVWHQFRSVLTEELICRGVLLYILIKRTGPKWAVLISSLLFAGLHWLNDGVWGNMTQMIRLFSFTFIMGLLLAYSYAKTFSLLIPFAIHFGWNLIQNFIFPEKLTGIHIFTLAAPPPIVTVSYFVFFSMLLLPKISVLVLDYLILKTYPQTDIP